MSTISCTTGNNSFTYKSSNFLATPKGNDINFRIYDKNGKLKYTLTPVKAYYYYKSRYVYIRQDGSNNITLDFENETDAILALKKLNDIKSQYFKAESDNSDYYTKVQLNNGILDFRYYTSGQTDDKFVDIDGDIMTGDLSIITLSGDTVVSMNINQVGQLIRGNQYLIRKTISSNNFIDSFSKTMDYSVFWEYSVKNGANIRAGVIIAAWDDVSNTISFTHYSSMDVGNTSDIDFVVGMDGSNTYVRLLATCTLTWDVKVLRRFI